VAPLGFQPVFIPKENSVSVVFSRSVTGQHVLQVAERAGLVKGEFLYPRKAFRSPDFDLLKQKLKSPIIFDGRNLYEPQAMQELGIEYQGIGLHN
jgi:UDP-glucose 6-dehydrogenase